MSFREIGWTVFGSVIVCSGMTLVGINAFRRQLPWVVAGFAFFVIGYRIMQYGTYGWPDKDSVATTDRDPFSLVKKGLGMTVSVVLAAYGFVLMGQAVQTQELVSMILSGASVVVGYMIGHRTVNDEVL